MALVMSNGFPGQVARTVTPNAKCSGCMHFQGQQAESGTCTVGLQPWLCGDGESPAISYAPVKNYGPHLPDDIAQVARAGAAPEHTPVRMQVVRLGDSHAAMVKSLVANHDQREQMLCRLHKGMSGRISLVARDLDPAVCSCEPVGTITLAKSLVGHMTNRERALVESADYLVHFVESIRKGMTAEQANAAWLEKAEAPQTERPYQTKFKRHPEPAKKPSSGFDIDTSKLRASGEAHAAKLQKPSGTRVAAVPDSPGPRKAPRTHVAQSPNRPGQNRPEMGGDGPAKTAAKPTAPQHIDMEEGMSESEKRVRPAVAQKSESVEKASVKPHKNPIDFKPYTSGAMRSEQAHGTYHIQKQKKPEGGTSHVLHYMPGGSEQHSQRIASFKSTHGAQKFAAEHHAALSPPTLSKPHQPLTSGNWAQPKKG